MKPTIYVFTGPPGCGKTTAVRIIAERLKANGIPVGGMITNEVRSGGSRTGFELRDISTGETALLAHVGEGAPRVGKYVVFVSNLERLGVSAIIRAVEKGSLVIIDEVGPMELFSQEFINSVEMTLKRSIAAIITVHFKSMHPLAQKVRREATRLIELRRGLPRHEFEGITTEVSEEIASRFGQNVAGE
ncbi:MAG: NTPase [Nitrososphaerota archaeon]